MGELTPKDMPPFLAEEKKKTANVQMATRPLLNHSLSLTQISLKRLTMIQVMQEIQMLLNLSLV